MNIDILLATFNPNLSFLHKQLDSICAQMYDKYEHKINVLIYDDASQNQKEVLLLLNEYKYDSWSIETSTDNQGFVEAYNHLIEKSTSELIFICDQDDIWDRLKLHHFISEYEKIEQINIPILLYSDIHCIDHNDKFICKSHLNQIGYNHSKKQCQFFLKNYVPGCSLAFNKCAKDLYLRTKNYIELHDYLLILIAIVYGSLIKINQVTMSYRFHSRNTLGRIRRKKIYILKDIYYSFRYFFNRKKFHERHATNTKKQLAYLYKGPKQDLKKNFVQEYSILRKIEKNPYVEDYSQFISGADIGEKCIEKMLFSKLV
jgi:glycosyltransferase involved in cell wall biosynthesis